MFSTCYTLPWEELSGLSDGELCERIEAERPLHPELFARVAALPAFGPMSAAALGRSVSRAGIVPDDEVFQRYVPDLPLLARAGCEFAIFWWFSQGVLDENTAAYAAVCEQVARDDCLDEAVGLLREARLSETIFGLRYMEETNDYIRVLCAVAATL